MVWREKFCWCCHSHRQKGVYAKVNAAFPCLIIVIEIVVIVLRMKRKGNDSQKYDDEKPIYFHIFKSH